MFDRKPWTREELSQMLPPLQDLLEQIEKEEAEVGNEIRPVPPLTKEEAVGYLTNLVEHGKNRNLTRQECFMHGQLLAQFEQAIIAEHLGKKGRYYVIPEDKIMELANAKQ